MNTKPRQNGNPGRAVGPAGFSGLLPGPLSDRALFFGGGTLRVRGFPLRYFGGISTKTAGSVRPADPGGPRRFLPGKSSAAHWKGPARNATSEVVRFPSRVKVCRYQVDSRGPARARGRRACPAAADPGRPWTGPLGIRSQIITNARTRSLSLRLIVWPPDRGCVLCQHNKTRSE